jgi:hypothetical protein
MSRQVMANLPAPGILLAKWQVLTYWYLSPSVLLRLQVNTVPTSKSVDQVLTVSSHSRIGWAVTAKKIPTYQSANSLSHQRDACKLQIDLNPVLGDEHA